MALYLDPLNGGRQIVFDKAVILIGRQSDCDIVLENSRKVSRKHCCIAQVNHQYLIRDLASMNGVRVNGKRIKQEAVLEVGAEVAIGDVRFVLKESNKEKRQPPAIPTAKAAAAPPAPKPIIRQPMDISQQFAVPIDEDVDGPDFAVEHSEEVDVPESPPAGSNPVQPVIVSDPAAPVTPSQDDVPEAIVFDDDVPEAIQLDDDSDLLPPLPK